MVLQPWLRSTCQLHKRWKFIWRCCVRCEIINRVYGTTFNTLSLWAQSHAQLSEKSPLKGGQRQFCPLKWAQDTASAEQDGGGLGAERGQCCQARGVMKRSKPKVLQGLGPLRAAIWLSPPGEGAQPDKEDISDQSWNAWWIERGANTGEGRGRALQ